MNTAIELHDSELSAITHDGSTVVLSFSPAYLHRSVGRPGYDAGVGWWQPATPTCGMPVSFTPELPTSADYNGCLRAGGVLHDNLVPVGVAFEVPCELELVAGSEPVVVRGNHLLSVSLLGEPTHFEDFTPAIAAA